jgi:hypothetical protein
MPLRRLPSRREENLVGFEDSLPLADGGFSGRATHGRGLHEGQTFPNAHAYYTSGNGACYSVADGTARDHSRRT